MPSAPAPRVFKLPLPAALASIIAFTALSVTGGGYVMLGILALAIHLSYAVPYRLGDDSWSGWMVRLLVFGVVVMANVAEPARERGHGFYDPAYIHAFGQLCAAELTIQCWRARPSGGPGGVMALLLSGLVLLTACNTFEYRYIRWLAGPYVFFAVLAIRAGAARAGASERRLARMPGAWLGTAVVLASIAAGFGMVYSLRAYRGDIYRLVRQLDDTIRGQRQSSGFNDRPSLGGRSSIVRSLARVLRLQGARPGTHLHGLAFETYEHGRWGPAVDLRPAGTRPVTDLNPGAQGTRCRITRLLDGYNYLFVPLNAVGVLPERVQEVEWDPTFLRVSAPAPYTYEVVLPETPDFQGPLCVAPDHAALERCLTVPSSMDHGVRERAAEVTRGQTTALDKVRAIEAYLRSAHTYSLEARPGPGDPVRDFILHEDRAGHCEYFAAAATVLMRCANVPSRYVVGYYAHERHGPGEMIVRQQDAHAWAEAWIEGVGWVTVDATPSDGMPDQTADALPLWRRAWEWMNDTALAIGDWFAERSFVQLGGIAAGIAALAISLLWLRELFARRRKRRAERPDYAHGPEAFAPLAERFNAWLAKAGAPCPAGRTWREHLAELAVPKSDAPRRALDLARVEAFVAEYTRARFGGGTPERLEELLRGLERGA
ncbi:MAG: transglutaminase domain-containing protein [Planctomycetota bacterium]|nr:transglutaminase domain-containing protein [Planctomycetota bacterium]